MHRQNGVPTCAHFCELFSQESRHYERFFAVEPNLIYNCSQPIKRRFPAMRYVLTLLIATAALGQSNGVINPHTTPADVAAGAKIFRSHCAECHGLAGEGGRGPNLASGVFYHGAADADLFANVTDGIKGTAMPGTFFSAGQVWQVVAYVRTLSQSRSDRPAGDAAHGEKLLREKGCINCHLARGEGGVRGPDLSVIGSQRSVEHLRQAILDPNAKVLREHWI